MNNFQLFTDIIRPLLIAFEIFFLTALALLVNRLLHPKVISFPWALLKKTTTTAINTQSKEKQQTVVMAGSFNPPHYGHLAMLSYLSKRYGNVIAVIGVNPNKKYDVSPQTRADMLRDMIQVYSDENGNIKHNVRVEVISYYIWRYAMKEKCSTMFRGIRSWEKDGKEEKILLVQNTWGPIVYGPFKWPLPTVYLEGNPKYNHISSTLIRQLCKTFKHDNHGITTQKKNTSLEEKTDEKLAFALLFPAELIDRVIAAYSSKTL